MLWNYYKNIIDVILLILTPHKNGMNIEPWIKQKKYRIKLNELFCYTIYPKYFLQILQAIDFFIQENTVTIILLQLCWLIDI